MNLFNNYSMQKKIICGNLSIQIVINSDVTTKLSFVTSMNETSLLWKADPCYIGAQQSVRRAGGPRLAKSDRK